MKSQSLFQWKLLCNPHDNEWKVFEKIVTILVLVETPLQQKYQKSLMELKRSHNPCFSGNSFATKCFLEIKFNPLRSQSLFQWKLLCNGKINDEGREGVKVTILVLVETPLQQLNGSLKHQDIQRHNPCFSGNSFATNGNAFDCPALKQSQSLFQWKLLCNPIKYIKK